MKVIMTTMVILVVITNICASIWRANKLGRYVDANTGRSSERFWYLFPNSVDEDDWFDLPQWLGRMFTYVVFPPSLMNSRMNYQNANRLTH